MSSKQLNVVLGVVVVVLLAIVGYMASRNGSQNNTLSQQDPNPTQPVVNTSTQAKQPVSTAPAEAPTEDWVTYQSASLGYEFQYPKSWIFDRSNDGRDIHLTNKPVEDKPLPGQVTLEIQPDVKKPATMDLLAYLLENRRTTGDTGLGYSCPCVKTAINGVPVIKTASHGGEGAAGPGYAIEKNSTTYTYFFVYGDAESATVNKIIASFKYIK